MKDVKKLFSRNLVTRNVQELVKITFLCWEALRVCLCVLSSVVDRTRAMNTGRQGWIPTIGPCRRPENGICDLSNPCYWVCATTRFTRGATMSCQQCSIHYEICLCCRCSADTL